jgi:hypothetical protein
MARRRVHCRGIVMSEIQESYALLQEVDRLLADIELKISNIERKAPVMERNLQTFRQLERVAMRYLILARQLGLPEDAEKAINVLARLLMVLRMVQMTMNLATWGPLGIVAAIPAAGMTALSFASITEGY